MAASNDESLNQLLANLHAGRVATWKPAAARTRRRHFFPLRRLSCLQHCDLEFAVGSDLANELGRRFGILYSFDEPSREAALARHNPIGDVTGTGTWELPKPAVLVIDRDRVVRFVEVSPDWLVRTEAGPIIEAVKALTAHAGPSALASG